jgi:hypothetical protein
MPIEQVTEPATDRPQSAGPASVIPGGGGGGTELFVAGLPSLTVAMSREEVVRRLDAAARRGKLAGFENHASEYLFEVEAYSLPFDHRLLAHAEETGDRTRLTFRMQMTRKAPIIFAISMILTLWPGLPLTHSMLLTYFAWYHYSERVTAAWYLPVFVLPLLWWVPRMIRKSRAAAAESAKEQVLKLRELLNGTLTQG